MELYKIAVIIPSYNESKTIKNVIQEILNFNYESLIIVVVNDCSSDNTAEVARKAGAMVLNLENNVGYAQAINQGLMYASNDIKADFLLTMDADGQHDPNSVDLMIKTMISNDNDIITGYRSKCARFSERLYDFYFRIFFDIKDPLCGLKCYKSELYLRQGVFESYNSIGTNLLMSSIIHGDKISQLPVNIRERYDAPRFGSLWLANKKIFFSLLSTMYRHVFNKYI